MKIGLLNVEIEMNAGTERLIATHANFLKKKGLDVEILCGYYNKNVFPNDFKKFKIKEYAKNYENKKKIRSTLLSRHIIDLDVSFLEKYDALICYRPFTNILAMKAKKKYKTKIFWYCSHPEKHLYPKLFKTLNDKKWIFKAILKKGEKLDKESIKYFDRIWVNSHKMWTKFNLIYEFNEHSVLYPPAGKLMKKSNKTGEYLISVSRISPEKNQAILLEALKLIKNKPKTAIIGKISNQKYYEYLKKIVKENNLPVEFLGELDDNEIQKWYDKSFLAVYTSYDEDFGIVPLECMSSGKPMVSHVSNGISEILPRRFVFSTIKELSEKIQSIKNNKIKPLSNEEITLPHKIKKEHLNEVFEYLMK
ncbi:MAG: glycosyltransferase family 4 protein [Candidatus Nanoarchaeia archaeon]|nr:glycosyltransferase family 4 protein [Candidatus Nanoarchaeia archaeon]MDD5053856.1 glycosyltransferase family 4 protein [Candidatus Nanoarchaeia archaeon]